MSRVDRTVAMIAPPLSISVQTLWVERIRSAQSRIADSSSMNAVSLSSARTTFFSKETTVAFLRATGEWPAFGFLDYARTLAASLRVHGWEAA